MAPKRDPSSAEYQQLLDENDALRAEIVKLKWQLENCDMIRQEQASYIRGLWEDNQRVHAELRPLKRAKAHHSGGCFRLNRLTLLAF